MESAAPKYVDGRDQRRLSTSSRRLLSRISALFSKSALTHDPKSAILAQNRCFGEQITYVCDHEHPQEKLNTVWWNGCTRPDCPKCSRNYGRSRGRKLWNRKLQYFGAENWWSFVFPLPSYYREIATKEKIKALSKDLWWRIQEYLRLIHFSGSHGVDFAGISVLHPEGDENPGVYHPHINFIVPCAGSWIGPDGMEKASVNPWLSKKHRQAFRNLFTSSLQTVFGIRPPKTVFHVSYKKTDGQKRHILRYTLRSFPGWPKWTRRYTSWGVFQAKGKRWSAYKRQLKLVTPTPYPISEDPVCSTCGEPLKLEKKGSDGIRFSPAVARFLRGFGLSSAIRARSPT